MSSPGGDQSHNYLPVWLQARIESFTRIGQIVWFAGSFYLSTLWAGLRRGQLSVLFGRTNHEVRDQAFADFFKSVEHEFAKYEDTTSVPQLVASAHGVVLDLGPGTGNQLERFDASKIEHVYGVEPNTAFTKPLMERLGTTKLGQDGKYTLIPCGIEDGETLAKFGVVEGSVDCIVSVQVLCSVPDLEEQVRHMHELLKPGGELIFWEHYRNPDRVTRAAQWLWCLLWPSVIGGCRLDRVTRDAVEKAADWEVIDTDTDVQPHMLMPRVWGRLVKRRAA